MIEQQKKSLQPEFRIADPGDIDTLLLLCGELYEYDGTPFHESVHRKSLEGLIANPAYGRVWLIFADGTAAGYLVLVFGYSLEFGGQDAFIDELYLREPFRGRGLGTQAMDFAATEAHALGIQALHLEVERTNTKAQVFYRKIGFTDHERYLMTKRV